MAASLDMESRNGRTSSGPPSSTSSSFRKPRKAIIESDPEDDDPPKPLLDLFPPLRDPNQAPTYSMDVDISKLEAPTFTTLDRGPSKTMMKLKWDHPVNLMGKKVVNPMIHCCDTCLKPILIYGRMIPCKHVFCLNCATAQAASCKRCGDKVTRIEPVGLGSIFMCSHGGSRYEHTGCRRTYLSQRDLQAHIQHRHVKGSAAAAAAVVSMQHQPQSSTVGAPAAQVPAQADHRKGRDDGRTTSSAAAYHDSSASMRSSGYQHSGGQQPPAPQTVAGYVQASSSAAASAQHHISVIGGSAARQSNLITVPIHDSSSNGVSIPTHPPPVVPGYPYGHSASGGSYSQPPVAPSSQHFYTQPQLTSSYSESSQTSQYGSQSAQWRTGGSSSYYRR